MLAHEELRNQLVRFLNKELSLDDFEDWFVRASWNIHKNPDLLAQRLAYAIEVRLAERSNGNLPDEQLRQELLDLANRHLWNLFQSNNYQSGSSTDLRVTTWVVPSSGKSLVMASESPILD
jgi:hypothetical protein